MEKENKILKNILKRKIKMTTAVLVAFLISGSLSFASNTASGLEPEEAARENVPPGSIPENPPEPNDPALYDPNETNVYTGANDGSVSIWSNTIKVTNGRNRIPIVDDQGIPKGRTDKLNKYVRGNSGTYYKDPDGVDAEGTSGGPDQDIRLEINEKSITLNHLSDDLKNYIDNRSAAGGTSGGGTAAPTNITSTTLNVTDAADGSGKNIELKNDTVDTDHLKDNAVTTDKLASNSVTSAKIQDGAVTTNKLGDNAVTEGKINDGAVTTNKLGDNAVTEGKINDGAVTTNKLGDNAVTEGKINDGAVTTNKLGDNAVTEGKINDGAVTTNKLGDNAVTEGKINDGAVTTNKLGDNAVTEGKINDGAVTTNKLGDNAVTENKINNGAVSRDKLSNALKTEIDGKVNRTEFTGDITSTTITVTGGNDKLLGDVTLEVANGAITADKLADNAVIEAKINNGAVSKDKLSNALKTEIDGKANKTEVYTKIDEVSITKDADGNGTVDVKGKDGKSGVSLNGKDGSIGINGKDKSSVSMTTEKGPKGIDEENEKSRMTYEFTKEKKNPDGTPVTETVKETLATMNDGIHFAGDNNATTISKKLNKKLEIVGGADRDKLTKNNIGVNTNAEGKLEVQLSKELKGMRSAEFTDPNTGNIVKITGEGTTITNPKTGDTVIMNQGGITISKTDKDGKPNNVSLSREGLSNGGNKITNVADGDISEGSTDAVNGGQLHQVQAQLNQNAQNIQNVNQKVDKLGERVNKGLAGAAAMSGIEFMEIGINQVTVAAAVGGYRGTHAVAVGVQAAPTENTRVNAKMSLSPGSRTEAMYSVGAAYRFNLK